MSVRAASPEKGARRAVVTGLVVVLGLVGTIGAWASLADIEGAIIAQGTVVVDSNARRVQHQEGGIVQELNARNGDRVDAGQILIRLDDTTVRAGLFIVERQLVDLTAREARLRAEMEGRDEVTTPVWPLRSDLEEQRRTVLQGEQALLVARRTSQRARVNQLGERRVQIGQLIEGLEAQQSAKQQEVTLIDRELSGLRSLFERNMVPITRVVALERERTRILGERGQLMAEIARSRGQISEIEIQIAELEERYRSEVLSELRQTESRIVEFQERRVASEDRLRRLEIRSPIAGTIHESEVHTIGGVVAQGQTLMLVVPEGDQLVVEARISPADIDQLSPNQAGFVRLSAFNQRTTPEFRATVHRISPDLHTDNRTGIQYYTARLRLERAAFEGRSVMPGMPVEAFFRTEARTVLTYFLKPLTDNMNRMLREE